MELFIFLIVALVFGWICSEMAKNRQRNSLGWFFGGFFFGILAIIVLALVGKNPSVPHD